ncbi:MAG: MBL fold metallo-hydrolase [Clostridia bacterium]
MAKRIVVDILSRNAGVTGSSKIITITFPEPIYTPNGISKVVSFMVDCGILQGEDDADSYNRYIPYSQVEDLAFVLLTHAHADHYGLIPLLIKQGFLNPIFTTATTKLFLKTVALEDCFKIMKRSSKKAHLEPVYEERDIEIMKQMMIGCPYNEKITYNDYIHFYFFSNGHVPGAASIFLEITYPGYKPIQLFFTGDYNNHNMFFPVEPIPEWVIDKEVFIITESTYGNVSSKQINDDSSNLVDNVVSALYQNKQVLIPGFAFGRIQEILADLQAPFTDGRLKPSIPVYVDGTTAVENTKLFLEGSFKMYPYRRNFLPKSTCFVENKKERQMILNDPSAKIILASSGMASYGASSVYVKHFIEDPTCLIHASGYVSPSSTLGKLKALPTNCSTCLGKEIYTKRANILDTKKYSAHAKNDVLIALLKQFKKINGIFIDHGEPMVREYFRTLIKDSVNTKDVVILSPSYAFRITSDQIVSRYPIIPKKERKEDAS